MQFFYKKIIFIIMFLVGSPLLCYPALSAENVQKTGADDQPAATEGLAPEKEKYEYQLDDRSDPFVPFVAKVVKSKVKNDEIVDDEGKELTGMQLFEPGQLTLVALMQTEENFVGMVQDVSGRGYMLKNGMLIGKRGVITEIDSDKITILETAYTRAGRTVKSNIVLSLNKEGD